MPWAIILESLSLSLEACTSTRSGESNELNLAILPQGSSFVWRAAACITWSRAPVRQSFC